jgi:hypothetical protein
MVNEVRAGFELCRMIPKRLVLLRQPSLHFAVSCLRDAYAKFFAVGSINADLTSPCFSSVFQSPYPHELA